VNPKRAYSSPIREQRAAETRTRIVVAAQELFTDASTDFTVERVAAMAGVSVQTVLRAFGNRGGLVHAAIGTVRASHGPAEVEPTAVEPFTSPAHAVTGLFDDYESIGDRVIRMLAEEHRVTGFAEVAATGRQMHRRWVEDGFGPALRAHPVRRRAEVLIAVLAATDVYVWKLLRRDLGLERAAAEKIVVRLIEGALEGGRGH
jgi:AcrR family transcriptional regulator